MLMPSLYLCRFLERMAAAGSERGPIGGGREFGGVPLCVTSQPVSDAPLLHIHAIRISSFISTTACYYWCCITLVPA